MNIIFFISLGVITYTYFGYPLMLVLLQVTSRWPVKKEDIYPSVTVFVSAHNEAKHIEAKVLNLLESDYPRGKLEIMVGSDGSTDETYQIIKRLAEERSIRYTVSFSRLGKPAMINKMARDATGDVYVFADARQRFAKDAIKNLVRPFADPGVGAVSGELILESGPGVSGQGIGCYWTYEKWLRWMESNIWSMLGATGAIYAIRKEYFHYLPDEVILDDIYTPMNAVVSGKRIVFEPAAKAYDTVAESTQKEFIRKVRTLAGNFQIFAMIPELFHPARSKIAFQWISHKFLRVIVPYFLIILFVSNIFLLGRGPFFVIFFVLQALFYAMALLGRQMEFSGKPLGMSGFPYEFCALNWAAIVAFMKFKKGEVSVMWEK
jgi:cellulose synthase/poly-beta-1,6-N-acetylglucosamine synthase-like glycosyltransferase